jgi:tetratricopeptide (TPR) repeat protein
MKTTRLNTLAAIAVAAPLLAACNATEPKKPEQESRAETPAATQPVEKLDARELTRRALDRFQEGEAQLAEQDLRMALQQKPNYAFAKGLLQQFEADPREYLGKESFDYQVKPGESLSMVAERFLGDKLQFVILARYNELAKPGRLDAGQTLRIPQRYKPAAAAVEPAAAPPAEPPAEKKAPPVAEESPDSTQEAYSEARALFDQGDFTGTIDRIEEELTAGGKADAKLRGLLTDAYGAYAGQLISHQKWQEARSVLRQAAESDPANDSIPRQLAFVEDKIEGQRLYAIAREHESQGDLDKAFTGYSDAVVYDKKNGEYTAAKERVGKQLANRYHRLALDNYRKEQLDQAKVYWTKVLEVDPDNRIAPGYLAKVEEIQQKIREMDGK